MRRLATLCAAGVALSALTMVSAAHAAPWSLIRYDNTGYCQIWDAGLTFKPWAWPSGYKTVGHPVPTLAAAIAARNDLVKHGKCRY